MSQAMSDLEELIAEVRENSTPESAPPVPGWLFLLFDCAVVKNWQLQGIEVICCGIN